MPIVEKILSIAALECGRVSILHAKLANVGYEVFSSSLWFIQNLTSVISVIISTLKEIYNA